MKRHEPYLIQRLIRNTVEGSLSDKRFGEIWAMDYMGSAEFEFGAFPKFMREMVATKLETFTLTIRGVKVHGVYDANRYENITEVETVLNGLADSKFHLKHSAHFPPDPKVTWAKASGWVDIDNGLFWSTESMNIAAIQAMRNSVKWMDEQKKLAK